MPCKFGMYTCAFVKEKAVCNDCNNADNYEYNENLKRRGGKRKGSGRKPKYNEPTTTVAFRVPVSKVEQVKQAVKKLLKAPK